jgi:two-component system OmpR family response regulator
MERKQHILIVEDEPDHLLAVEMTLSLEEEFVLHTATNTKEAETVLESAPIDIVILDLALPQEDGLSFCKRMKEELIYRDLPFVAFSAYPSQMYRDRSLAAGCADFIEKPFSSRRLLEVVRKILSTANMSSC